MNGYVLCPKTLRCFRIDYHYKTWHEAEEQCQDDLVTFDKDLPDLVWLDKQPGKQLSLGGILYYDRHAHSDST